MPRKHASEWKNGVVHRARLRVAVFQTTNRFSRHFIWPGPRFAGRFVGAVKLKHQFVFGCFPKQCLIEIDDFFSLMIEEVDLRAHYSEIITKQEKLSTIVRCSQGAAVFPDPNANLLLAGIVGKLPHFCRRPTLPETFNDVVFKPQLSSEARKYLHSVKRVLAAIQVFPNSSTRFDPAGVESGGKELLVGRRRDVADDVAVHQRV